MPEASPTLAGHVPSPDLVALVASLIARLGVGRAARELHIGREALARLAGGLPVRAGTIALATQSLASLAPPPARRAARRGAR